MGLQMELHGVLLSLVPVLASPGSSFLLMCVSSYLDLFFMVDSLTVGQLNTLYNQGCSRRRRKVHFKNWNVEQGVKGNVWA